jgi:hypothetical protein
MLVSHFFPFVPSARAFIPNLFSPSDMKPKLVGVNAPRSVYKLFKLLNLNNL